MDHYFFFLAISFILIVIFHILSKKIKTHHSFFMRLAGYAGVIYIAIFIVSLLEITLRYKNYPPSSYRLVLKEGDKTYSTGYYIPFIYDRLTGEIYIELVYRGKTYTSLSDGEEFNTLFLLDNKEYYFKNKDLRLNYNPAYIKIRKDHCSFHLNKEKNDCDMLLKYRGKTLHFNLSDYKNDPKLKEIPINGTSYAYSFTSFKSFFGIRLSVERDDDNKVIYLVRDKQR